jgi:hypothetical protein
MSRSSGNPGTVGPRTVRPDALPVLKGPADVPPWAGVRRDYY